MIDPDFKRYGLVPGERAHLEAQQGGKCAICGRPPKTRRLHVDHHHACYRYDKRASVRGLLCHRCNRGLFGENPELMESAVRYFRAHICPPKPRVKR